MRYTTRFESPVGTLVALAEDEVLKGLWYLEDGDYDEGDCAGAVEDGEREVFRRLGSWLARYFAGENPEIDFEVKAEGTPFQETVWRAIREIPYGGTATYGELARRAAEEGASNGVAHRAVGGAVGRNPVSIVIPCHRVVRSDGGVGGYTGMLWRKRLLLKLEWGDAFEERFAK